MNKLEVIKQLESFLSDCKEFESVNPTEKDIQALEVAMSMIKGTDQEVQVQEQLRVTYDYGILEKSKLFITTDKSFYERMKKNPKFVPMFNPDLLVDPRDSENTSNELDFNFYCFRILVEE